MHFRGMFEKGCMLNFPDTLNRYIYLMLKKQLVQGNPMIKTMACILSYAFPTVQRYMMGL